MLYMAGKQWFSASRLPKKLNKAAEEVEVRTAVPLGNPKPFWSNDEKPAKAVCNREHVLNPPDILTSVPGPTPTASPDQIQPPLRLFRAHGRLRHRCKPSP